MNYDSQHRPLNPELENLNPAPKPGAAGSWLAGQGERSPGTEARLLPAGRKRPLLHLVRLRALLPAQGARALTQPSILDLKP